MDKKLRLVIISDTHGWHDQINIPPGDVLIHAGDFTNMGELPILVSFNEFLKRQPHQYKIVVAGNHDFCFQDSPGLARATLTEAIYLEDSGIEIEGVYFHGSPWQPWFMDYAFNIRSETERAEKWAMIPDHTDVLITHSPPFGHGDWVSRSERVGCRALLERVEQIRPKFHIFGHIHESFGITRNEHTTFVNACNCNLQCQPVQPATVIDIGG